MSKSKDSSVLFIFITVLLDVIGFGVIIPVLPELLIELKAISVNEASVYGGYLLLAFAIPQFLFSPLMGNLSDRFGRRPIILLSLLGFSIDYLLLAFAPTYFFLLLGRVVAGFFGASFTTASAYIADISNDEDRSSNFGLLGAAFGLGFIIGPLLGGVLGSIGLRVPFFVAAGLTLINFLYGYFILPESLALEDRRPFEWKRANPISAFKHLASYKNINLLLLAYFLLYLGSHAVSSNWTFFTMYKFEWSELMIGLSLAIVGALVAIVQGGLSRKAADKIGINKSVVLGFGLYSLGMFLFSISDSTISLFIYLIPYCLGGIAIPNLQAIMVSQVKKTEQGELQGGLTSLQSMTTIIGPILMTSLFSFFTSPSAPFQFAGAPFFLGGVLMLISFLITLFLFRKEL